MACQNCRQQARRLTRSLQMASELSASPSPTLSPLSRPVVAMSSPTKSPRAIFPRRHRNFSHSAWRRAADTGVNKTGPSRPRPTGAGTQTQTQTSSSEKSSPALSSSLQKSVAETLAYSMPGRTGSAYVLGGQLESLYKACSAPAAYTVSEELQRKGEVPKTAEGEELGKPEGPWPEIFNLTPSFSSWSHVTMLHMYLIVTRMRCLERRTSRQMQAQFIDNFFFDCERVMHLNHGMTSSTLRQRYLKDIFTQWRGLVAAYDEGVARGSDRVLAAALWRNLFKAREDTDPRALAAVVAWTRATMRDLDATSVEELLQVRIGGAGPFGRDPRAMFRLVDEPSSMIRAGLRGV